MARAFFLFIKLYPLMQVTSYGQTTPCDSVYSVVDEMPKFGKEDFDLMSYFAKHVQFGSCGLDEMKILTWTIDRTGNMINIDAPSLEGQCRQKIIEQLKAFPRWKPGRLNGKPVCVKMSFRMCIKTG